MSYKCGECGSIMVRDGGGDWYYCERCHEEALAEEKIEATDDSIVGLMHGIKKNVDNYNKEKK